jgi:hypothetical protein
MGDSTVVSKDSVATESVLASEQPDSLFVPLPYKLATEVYEISNQGSYISDPFAFSLNVQELRNILGDSIEVTEQDFEGGEDYPAYSYSTVKWGDNELKFYDYSGKHYASVETPLLLFRNDVKIGMTRSSFIDNMQLPADATDVSEYVINDDYGQMSFHFRADTLYWIYVSYEEGD